MEIIRQGWINNAPRDMASRGESNQGDATNYNKCVSVNMDRKRDLNKTLIKRTSLASRRR
jgi:hypothetical protein